MHRFLMSLMILALALFPTLALAQEAVEDGSGLFFRVFYPGLATLLLSVLAWAFLLLRAWVRENTKSLLLRRLLDTVAGFAGSAVREINQTFVDALKDASKDGVLTSPEKAEALRLAKARAKSLLTAGGIWAEVMGVFGSGGAEDLLTTALESAVGDVKGSDGPVFVIPAPDPSPAPSAP